MASAKPPCVIFCYHIYLKKYIKPIELLYNFAFQPESQMQRKNLPRKTIVTSITDHPPPLPHLCTVNRTK